MSSERTKAQDWRAGGWILTVGVMGWVAGVGDEMENVAEFQKLNGPQPELRLEPCSQGRRLNPAEQQP